MADALPLESTAESAEARASREAALLDEKTRLKIALAEKALELDFFRGSLQKIESAAKSRRDAAGESRRIYQRLHPALHIVLSYLEVFIDRIYNRLRLHSALGYRSPEQFGAERASEPAAALRLSWHGRCIDPIVEMWK